MATVGCQNEVNGDWSVGSDWNANFSTGATDDAVISVAGTSGTYTVTISTPVSGHSLTLNNSHATVSENDGASLSLSGDLTLPSGTFQANGMTTLGTLGRSGRLVTGLTTLSGGGETGWGRRLRRAGRRSPRPFRWTVRLQGSSAATDSYVPINLIIVSIVPLEAALRRGARDRWWERSRCP